MSIAKWHEQTFPDATLQGQLEKMSEETAEYIVDNSLEELADMFIVCCGMTRYSGIAAVVFFNNVFAELNKLTPADRINFDKIVDAKMEKNRARVWAKSGDGLYHHTNKESK